MNSFRLPIGNKAHVGSMMLRSNGKVDKKEGLPPGHGIKNIEDPRVEKFIQSRDASVLGEGWHGYSEPDYDTGRITAGGNAIPRTDDSVSAQFLILDPKKKSITLQTQGLEQEHFNHWIQASFDRNGQINPKTIAEWVSN
jgi:hypothetical protein